MPGRCMCVTCAVVVSAGAVETPALLLRSGLKNPNVGRWLRLHPATAVFGIFDEQIRPWEGTMQALYSDEHRHLDDGYGVKYEPVPAHPALLTAALPWEGAAEHARLMASLPISVRDRRDPAGPRFRPGPDRPRRRADRDLPARRRRCAPAGDRSRRRGKDHGRRGRARGLRCECPHATVRGSLPARRVPLRPRPRRALLVPHHGLCPDGRDPETSAANPAGETWEVPNLVVADGSAFPTASGVNPMITIEAIAYLNARRLVEKLA